MGQSATQVLLTTVVGSYPQPEWLVDRVALGGRLPPRTRAPEIWRVAPELLEQAQDDATRLAIRDQERAGIDVITDGEMRRYAFYGHLIDSLDGFDKFGGWGIEFRDETGEKLRLQRPVVVEKLRWRRHMAVEDWKNRPNGPLPGLNVFAFASQDGQDGGNPVRIFLVKRGKE